MRLTRFLPLNNGVVFFNSKFRSFPNLINV